MNCKKCGKQIEDGFNNCPNCGESVAAKTKQKKPIFKKWWFWLIIAVVLIGIIGAAGMLSAFPVYRYLAKTAKAELTPRILLLADELSKSK